MYVDLEKLITTKMRLFDKAGEIFKAKFEASQQKKAGSSQGRPASRSPGDSGSERSRCQWRTGSGRNSQFAKPSGNDRYLRSASRSAAHHATGIAISIEAFEAITRTPPLGSVAYEAEPDERGERLIWLEAAMADLLFPPSATVLCSARRG